MGQFVFLAIVIAVSLLAGILWQPIGAAGPLLIWLTVTAYAETKGVERASYGKEEACSPLPSSDLAT